ncbi:MAG: thiol peroxidase [Owenweeksia sp.]
MADILFKGNLIKTAGEIPQVGDVAPEFKLTATDMQDKHLSDYRGKKLILNIFPSIDTGICAASVRKFNKEASNLSDTMVLCISKDLPFAQKRFCGAEGIENVVMLSEFKDQNFSREYHVTMTEGPLAGLMSRAIVVLDPDGSVIYSEQVPEITQEPDYDKALQSI